MSRPQCILLDAGPVIALHAVGAWNLFCNKFDVVVPETVADDEALWHSPDEVTGSRLNINLRADERAGKVRIDSATSSEMLRLVDRFDDSFSQRLHAGELEGLALLAERESYVTTAFCAGDAAAIQAAVMAGLDERTYSLERLLDSVGLTKRLEWQYSQEFFENHRRIGLDNRMSGLGFSR